MRFLFFILFSLSLIKLVEDFHTSAESSSYEGSPDIQNFFFRCVYVKGAGHKSTTKFLDLDVKDFFNISALRV